jgi:hypothetical protein
VRFTLPTKLAACAAALVGLVGLVATASSQTPVSGPPGDIGAFHVDCGFSHRKQDDPIVFPSQAGAAHMHDFAGANGTDASSTNASIRRAESTCRRDDETPKWQDDGTLRPKYPQADKSAYWVPTVYDNGVPLTSGMSAYYVSGRRDFRRVQPFPPDLRVIAGDAKGGPTWLSNQPRIVQWRCAPGQKLEPGSSDPPVAPTCRTERLDLEIRFPDCWNGRDSDSQDHKSHMAYSRKSATGPAYVCPPEHPVLVPALRLVLRYPTSGGAGVTLASGGINTAHADFMNGWDPDRLAQLVRDCLNTDSYCGGGSMPVHGNFASGKRPSGRNPPKGGKSRKLRKHSPRCQKVRKAARQNRHAVRRQKRIARRCRAASRKARAQAGAARAVQASLNEWRKVPDAK